MKKSLLFAAGFAMAALPLSAQKLADGYIVQPSSKGLPTYISQWNGGAGSMTVVKEDPNNDYTLVVTSTPWEDEEFYTSRVKPRARFYNTATQVYSDLTQYNSSTGAGTDHRYLNWVPIGNADFNALPNAVYDSEAFSMWSYVDHYGDWTSAYGWAPAAFADAAHKNGVAVSGVASVPFGGIDTKWKNELEKMGNLSAETVGKFLYYHGVDGLGYNSEWSSYAPTKLITLHSGLYTYMTGRNPIFENVWYGGTNDSGSIAFDTGLDSNKEIFKGSSIFLNYNWNRSSYTSTVPGVAKGLGRNPFHVYAGMNQEGSSSDNGGHFATIKNIQYSIGIWGSHQVNQFWKEHGVGGTTSDAVQRYYLDQTEQWYTNVSRNPAIRGTLANIGQPVLRENWAGISALVSARSVLNMNLQTEAPFYTFFNLGNGKFFNWKGERLNNNEWYSLGIQDYLPTWRFWFADTWMNTNVSKENVHMSANFTWDDAYVGGSCLKISGSAESEYLHLFKTDFAVASSNTVYRVTFKILGGSADIDLSLNGASGTTERKIALVTKDQCADIENKSYTEGADGWTTIEVKQPNIMGFSKVGVIGLHFKNAENLELLLGGLEVDRGGAWSTVPATPKIKSSKLLANTYTGIDGKLIWTMDDDAGRNAGTPVYNSDVKTSMFKVYSQEEGGEPQFLGATTSWAAIGFRAPNTDATKKIRFGAAAVSMDTKAESEIGWGEWLTKGEYTASNEVVVSKTMIKPGEGFSCYYADERHDASTWTLVDALGNTVATGSGVRIDVENGLPQGGYDLVLDKGTANERKFGYFVQVSSEEVGALPEIYTLTHEGAEAVSDVEIDLTDTPTLGYTGRKADGSASRALTLNNHWIGANVAELGITSTSSVSVGGWFKFNALPEKEWNFINIVNKNDSWPQNEWGWCWNHGMPDGSLEFVFRGNDSDTSQPGELHYSFPDTRIQPGIWTHIMMVFEKSGSNFRCLLYINGVKQESTWYQTLTGQNKTESQWLHRDKTTDDWCPGIQATRADASYVLFGGTVYQGASIDGICDDFQVWNKAVTEDEVKLSMAGITSANVPEGLACLWDFETDAVDNFMTGIGSAASAKLSTHEWNTKQGNNTEGAKEIQTYASSYTPGSPFLAGTAYPVVTEAVWKDTDRKTQFTKIASRAATEGEAGSASVKFVSTGDHTVTLTLENNYGSDSKQFPVFSVSDKTQGIGDIAVDGGEMNAYTVDNVLFLEFAQDGLYEIEVYNAAGMLVGAKKLDAVAGQNARITLGAKGVYLVKASANGQALRTVKVLSK